MCVCVCVCVRACVHACVRVCECWGGGGKHMFIIWLHAETHFFSFQIIFISLSMLWFSITVIVIENTQDLAIGIINFLQSNTSLSPVTSEHLAFDHHAWFVQSCHWLRHPQEWSRQRERAEPRSISKPWMQHVWQDVYVRGFPQGPRAVPSQGWGGHWWPQKGAASRCKFARYLQACSVQVLFDCVRVCLCVMYMIMCVWTLFVHVHMCILCVCSALFRNLLHNNIT